MTRARKTAPSVKKVEKKVEVSEAFARQHSAPRPGWTPIGDGCYKRPVMHTDQ